jgi:hypothetical protein
VIGVSLLVFRRRDHRPAISLRRDYTVLDHYITVFVGLWLAELEVGDRIACIMMNTSATPRVSGSHRAQAAIQCGRGYW